jgi:hypothetical protein
VETVVVHVTTLLRARVVCGRIASGKTTVTRALAARHGWDVVSFGAHVKAVAEHQEGSLHRAALQALGAHMLAELGADGFLRQVLATVDLRSPIQLYDGVRHRTMLSALRRAYRDTATIYLDLPDDERYVRWARRAGAGDEPPSIGAFRRADAHPIEQGVPALRAEADVVVDTGPPLADVLETIEHVLAARSHTWGPTRSPFEQRAG